MSRIKTLPKEQKEDWKKELDNNKYVHEGIQILAEKAKAEAKAEAAEAAINAYRKGKEEGELEQLILNIAKMRSKGMSDE